MSSYKKPWLNYYMNNVFGANPLSVGISLDKNLSDLSDLDLIFKIIYTGLDGKTTTQIYLKNGAGDKNSTHPLAITIEI